MTANRSIKIIVLIVGCLIIFAPIYWYYALRPQQCLSTQSISSNDVILTSCGTEDLGEVISKVRTAIVYITGKKTINREQPSDPIMFTPPIAATGDKMGSGMIIDKDGYILTNFHVIAETSNLKVKLFGEADKIYPCTVIETLPEKDLAVIKINTGFLLPEIKPGNSDMIELAEEVLAIGCPFSLEQSVTHGIISDVKRTVTIEGRNYIDLIQTDAVINSGNSGGALVNMDGEVIGINVAIYAPTRVYCGVGFAIPINHAKLLMMKIKYLKGES